MFLSMFPAGLLHMYTAMAEGLWAARTRDMYNSALFQNLAKGRAFGGHIFLWGGLVPLVYFVISRYFYLKPTTNNIDKNRKYDSFWLDAAHTAPYQTLKKVNYSL
eukprot:UN11938